MSQEPRIRAPQAAPLPLAQHQAHEPPSLARSGNDQSGAEGTAVSRMIASGVR